MRLTIENGTLFVDNLFFAYAGVGNDRTNLQPGCYPVATQFSHKFGQDLPNAYGLGWIGADKGCDIFLGRVRKGTDTLPCSGHLSRLLALLEAAEDRGALVELVVRKFN